MKLANIRAAPMLAPTPCAATASLAFGLAEENPSAHNSAPQPFTRRKEFPFAGAAVPFGFAPDAHETNETWHDIGPKHRLAIATIINGLLARPAKSVGPKSKTLSER